MKGTLVVVGDTLLDVDLDGTATRLTPDAPVPVVADAVERDRPGGAGLAALLAARAGHDVVLVTMLGRDVAGQRVRELLAGVRLVELAYDGPTSVKRRVRADGHPLLRVDHGAAPGIWGGEVPDLEEVLGAAAAVLVSDYGRGVTSVPALREALSRRTARLPVVWDPHPRGADPVPGCTVVTPSLAEATALAGARPDNAVAAAAHAAPLLVDRWASRAVAVSLGRLGALLSWGSGAPVLAPVDPVDGADPCGAGDAFAVSLTASLGAGRLLTEALGDAVAAASAYVAAGGPAPLSTTSTGMPWTGPTAPAGSTLVATGGCFDLLHAGHVATLQAARGLGDRLVVCLNSDASVRRLKGPGRPLVPAVQRATVLRALACVDEVVVFDEDTPERLLAELRPDLWVKGGDYAGAQVAEAQTLRAWGGQVVTMPYLDGWSTSRLAEAAGQTRGAKA